MTKSNELRLSEELIIYHQGFSKVTEGWHKAWVHDVRPYSDSWGDKMMIYFRLDGDPNCENPLVWIAPLLATPRNKTGRFLEAIGIKITDGHRTNTKELFNRGLWLRTTLITTNQSPFYKVTHFNQEYTGGDLFDAAHNSHRQNTGAGVKAEFTAGPRWGKSARELHISMGTNEPGPRPSPKRRVPSNRRPKPGYSTP